MSNSGNSFTHLPWHQQAIRAKCVHPSGSFIEFTHDEIEQSIPARFEQQVAKYPDRLAVKTKTQALTYTELNQAANRVAHALLAGCGEGPEPVALLFGKEVSLIVATLGVLKAGKMYMPLNASFPPVRISAILEDAQAGLLLTNNAYLSLATSLQTRVPLLNIDEIVTNFSSENPDLPIAPDALACIFYTSGSTGQPKGVVENHRNFLHFIRNQTNSFHICVHDRVTFLASQGKDIFQSLLNGATVYPVDITQEGLADLAQWLIQEEITIYYSTTSVFRHFVNTLTGDEQFPALRLIVLLGEPVYKRDVELYRKYFTSSCIFVNALGSTETANFRQYFMDQETTITGNVIPAGYAVPDKEVILFDEAGKMIGFHQTGEIAIKSRYLSPGYWRRPDLTQAKFFPDPAGGDERIYRTGDLGVMQPDGCLLYLGRKDFQVKIRGQRVELAEVEMALLALETVKEAVVIAQEDVPGSTRLVAYIVPSREPAPTIRTLRQTLAETLPAYMIPTTFVMVDKLPLIGIGKVDRRSLPAPGGTRPALETPFVAPRTPVEEMLTRIWATILGLDQVGIYDHFLDLGGHSLQATQIITRIIHTFRIDLPVRSLFEAPTIAAMAIVITQYQAKRAGQEEMVRMLAELEALSEDEAQTHFVGKRSQQRKREYE